jgi:hypothetical protein
VIAIVVRAGDPPLVPSPDEGRDWLRRELLHPDYHQRNLLQELLDWLERRVTSGLETARDAPPLTTFAAMVVLLGLVLALGWLLSRVRRSAGTRTADRAVLTDEVVTAHQLRSRAEAALAEGRFEDAVVDGFRALAARQVERGRLDDAPGATAHEVAAALAATFPDRRRAVTSSALLFEAVLYGGRRATADQAREVLGLDRALAAAR